MKNGGAGNLRMTITARPAHQVWCTFSSGLLALITGACDVRLDGLLQAALKAGPEAVHRADITRPQSRTNFKCSAGSRIVGPCVQGVLDPVIVPCPMSLGCAGLTDPIVQFKANAFPGTSAHELAKSEWASRLAKQQSLQNIPVGSYVMQAIGIAEQPMVRTTL